MRQLKPRGGLMWCRLASGWLTALMVTVGLAAAEGDPAPAGGPGFVDGATRAAMAEFYRALWHDRPAAGKAEALRRAQRAMIRGYNPAKRVITRGVAGFDRPTRRPGRPLHPYFWAGFTLYGDWR
jgi:hypothetical protein